MNKLGFYIENSTIPFLREAFRQVKPPTVLIHAGDRGLLQEIRRELTPNAFVVGRLFVDAQEQTAWLDSPEPEARGRAFADRIIAYDFGMAKERGSNGRLLIDAWMALNESPPGPASYRSFAVTDEFRRRVEALDRFQVAFLERLRGEGLEGVAFNFAAGNYTEPNHYLEWFPRSLESFKYLGFHEYGWPTLMENEVLGTSTGALYYRRCMEGIRQRYGDRHRCIITEAGLARMYKHQEHPPGDVGWLYAGDTIPQEQYWESLRWYNRELVKDDYVLGACLFQVGHAGRWETFRLLGVDNQQRPITLISQIASLNDLTPGEPQEPTKPQEPAKPESPETPSEPDLAELQRRIAQQITALDAAYGRTSHYINQVATLTATLEGLVATATQAASLPQDVTRLLARLSTLDAQVDGLVADGSLSISDATAARRRITDLRAQVTGLQPAAQQAAGLSQQVSQARRDLAPLAEGAVQAESTRQRVVGLQAEAHRLATEAGMPRRDVAHPETVAARQLWTETRPPAATRSLEARAPEDAYPTRSLDSIRRIVIHHTMTRSDVSPEHLAEMHTRRGLPGIKYHVLVDEAGVSYWTQPLTAVLPQTGLSSVNADSVAVALAGNYSRAVPGDAQVNGAAQAIAYLLSQLQLGPDAVYGRTELDPDVISPGSQWLQGVSFKDKLLGRVADIFANTPSPGKP